MYSAECSFAVRANKHQPRLIQVYVVLTAGSVSRRIEPGSCAGEGSMAGQSRATSVSHRDWHELYLK